MTIFDSHAHYDDDRFAEDREAVLAALPGSGVRYVCNIGASLASSRAGAALAARYPFVYFAAGIHPENAAEPTEDDWRELEELLGRQRAVAVGEIGLDYHYESGPDRATQRAVFERQMALAQRLGKPVVVHARDAMGDAMGVVRGFPAVRGVFHCYSGGVEDARELTRRGWYLGFTGVITFKNARRALEVLQSAPRDRILVETDCPYLAPEPHRGERCDSRLLVHTLARMAETLGVTPEEAAALTCANAMKFYGIEG
jgi:TatD DNase family protein